MFGGRKPGLYSYQGSLPKLPLPSIDDTLKRVIIPNMILLKFSTNNFERRLLSIVAFIVR